MMKDEKLAQRIGDCSWSDGIKACEDSREKQEALSPYGWGKFTITDILS